MTYSMFIVLQYYGARGAFNKLVDVCSVQCALSLNVCFIALSYKWPLFWSDSRMLHFTSFSMHLSCRSKHMLVSHSGNALDSTNVVALRRARLVPGWVTV